MVVLFYSVMGNNFIVLFRSFFILEYLRLFFSCGNIFGLRLVKRLMFCLGVCGMILDMLFDFFSFCIVIYKVR